MPSITAPTNPTAPSTPSAPSFIPGLALRSLPADVILQSGDNDSRRVWGGKQRSAMAGQPVHELQQALLTLGAMSATPDGDFGPKTKDAVARFQWYLGRIGQRLRLSTGADALHGVLETYTAPSGVRIDGFVRAATLAELLAWLQGGFELTSPLLAKSVAGLSNIRLADSFEVLDYPSPGGNQMLVHQDFVPRVTAMNAAAKNAKVTLRINQSFRVQGLPVSGAVVPPASKSQHLIGHAMDLNIVDGSLVNTSAMFIAGTASQGAKDFVKAAKSLGLRWGGDFSPKDPPHFDDFIDPSGAEYDHSFYFAQRSFHAHHPMRTA